MSKHAHTVDVSGREHLEEWRTIPEFSGKYEASSLGRVRNKRTGLVLKQRLNPKRYPVVELCDGKSRECMVHRLMLSAFFGPAPEGHEGCHGNGIKTDNRIENLELMKRVDHSVHHNHQALTDLQVRMVRELYDRGEADMMQLAERFKATISRICRIIRGETRASVGGPINRNNKSRRYQKKREWSQVPEELQR